MFEVEHVVVAGDAEGGVFDSGDHQRSLRPMRLHGLGRDAGDGGDLGQRGAGIAELGEQSRCRGDDAQPGLVGLTLAQLGPVRPRRPRASAAANQLTAVSQW